MFRESEFNHQWSSRRSRWSRSGPLFQSSWLASRQATEQQRTEEVGVSYFSLCTFNRMQRPETVKKPVFERLIVFWRWLLQETQVRLLVLLELRNPHRPRHITGYVCVLVELHHLSRSQFYIIRLKIVKSFKHWSPHFGCLLV